MQNDCRTTRNCESERLQTGLGVADGKDKTYYEMTPEEALDALTCGYLDVCDIEPYMETIIKCIEKQIPKKPKKDEYGFLHCPCCDYDDYSLMHDSNFADRYNHCHRCGQKLLWEE